MTSARTEPQASPPFGDHQLSREELRVSDHEALLSLATRCEALSGPCRETDAMIAKATGWVPGCINAELWNGDEDSRPEWWFSDAFGMPAYTASIDSAMSLAPACWWVRTTSGNGATARLWLINKSAHADAATLPLALTAASLRALAQPTVPQP